MFSNFSDAANLLIHGSVGVLPTDTVYGLVCRAADQAAVKRLYEIKEREKKPGTLIAASIDQLVELGFKRRYLTAVEQFWPGAVSVETPFSDSGHGYITQGQSTIGVRIPDDKNLLNLLSKTGPLQTTSANPTGSPTATTIKQAKDYFGDNVDFYVDGGDLSNREPSTIIRIVDDAVEVLRAGAVKIDDNGVAK